MSDTSFSAQPVGDFLDRLAERSPAPGGGSVAALTLAAAAGLVAMAARYAAPAGSDEPVALAADRLRRQAAELADRDAAAYAAVLAAYRLPTGPDQVADEAMPVDEAAVEPAVRQRRIREALEAATVVPLRVAELGVETAGLAASVAQEARRELIGDAVAGLLLAEAAVRCAAELVAVNVAAGDLDPALGERARDLVKSAARHVRGAPQPSTR